MPYFHSFFFTATPTTETYTLSLHDALPIYPAPPDRPAHDVPAFLSGNRDGAGRRPREECDQRQGVERAPVGRCLTKWKLRPGDRKSTRLNSSHSQISYAVFCLKKKKK